MARKQMGWPYNRLQKYTSATKTHRYKFLLVSAEQALQLNKNYTKLTKKVDNFDPNQDK